MVPHSIAAAAAAGGGGGGTADMRYRGAAVALWLGAWRRYDMTAAVGGAAGATHGVCASLLCQKRP